MLAPRLVPQCPEGELQLRAHVTWVVWSGRGFAQCAQQRLPRTQGTLHTHLETSEAGSCHLAVSTQLAPGPSLQSQAGK